MENKKPAYKRVGIFIIGLIGVLLLIDFFVNAFIFITNVSLGHYKPVDIYQITGWIIGFIIVYKLKIFKLKNKSDKESKENKKNNGEVHFK